MVFMRMVYVCDIMWERNCAERVLMDQTVATLKNVANVLYYILNIQEFRMIIDLIILYTMNTTT